MGRDSSQDNVSADKMGDDFTGDTSGAQSPPQTPQSVQQDPTWQLQQQVMQGNAPFAQPPGLNTQQQSSVSPLIQRLTQQYMDNMPRPVNGGRIKQLLGNFVGGASEAGMRFAGIPTPEQQQQQRLLDINTLSQTQSLDQLRQSQEAHNAAMLQNFVRTPAEPELAQFGIAPGTMMTPQEKVQAMMNYGKNQATIAASQGRGVQAAQINAQNKTPTEIALRIRADQGDADAQRVLDRMQQDKLAQQTARGYAFKAFTPLPEIDENGNMRYDWAKNAIAQGNAPAAQGVSVMSKQAQFSEMKSASQKFRSAIQGLDREFTPDQIAKLQLAQRAPDEGVVRNITDSILGDQNLTPAQQDYVIWHNQMMERILSLRNVAGMGQGAQDLRSAIQATVPGPKSGSKEFSLKKMDAVDNQINLLSRGIPGMGKGAGGGGINAPKSFSDWKNRR